MLCVVFVFFPFPTKRVMVTVGARLYMFSNLVHCSFSMLIPAASSTSSFSPFTCLKEGEGTRREWGGERWGGGGVSERHTQTGNEKICTERERDV